VQWLPSELLGKNKQKSSKSNSLSGKLIFPFPNLFALDASQAIRAATRAAAALPDTLAVHRQQTALPAARAAMPTAPDRRPARRVRIAVRAPTA
jgi:hypothetical protein